MPPLNAAGSNITPLGVTLMSFTATADLLIASATLADTLATRADASNYDRGYASGCMTAALLAHNHPDYLSLLAYLRRAIEPATDPTICTAATYDEMGAYDYGLFLALLAALDTVSSDYAACRDDLSQFA